MSSSSRPGGWSQLWGSLRFSPSHGQICFRSNLPAGLDLQSRAHFSKQAVPRPLRIPLQLMLLCSGHNSHGWGTYPPPPSSVFFFAFQSGAWKFILLFACCNIFICNFPLKFLAAYERGWGCDYCIMLIIENSWPSGSFTFYLIFPAWSDFSLSQEAEGQVASRRERVMSNPCIWSQHNGK